MVRLVQFSKVFASLGDNYLSISSTTSPVNYFFEIFLAFFIILLFVGFFLEHEIGKQTEREISSPFFLI